MGDASACERYNKKTFANYIEVDGATRLKQIHAGIKRTAGNAYFVYDPTARLYNQPLISVELNGDIAIGRVVITDPDTPAAKEILAADKANNGYIVLSVPLNELGRPEVITVDALSSVTTEGGRSVILIYEKTGFKISLYVAVIAAAEAQTGEWARAIMVDLLNNAAMCAPVRGAHTPRFKYDARPVEISPLFERNGIGRMPVPGTSRIERADLARLEGMKTGFKWSSDNQMPAWLPSVGGARRTR